MNTAAARASILSVLLACASTPAVETTPAPSPPLGQAGDASEGGRDGAPASAERAACGRLPDVAPYVGQAYFARSGDASSGAWLFAFAYPGALAPTPGAGFAANVLDRGGSLVEHPVDLATSRGKLRGAPLVRPYMAVQCNGAPPCAPGESVASYLASEGTAIVHEHAHEEGGRFALEIWMPLLRRLVGSSGLTFSNDPKDCFQATRIQLTASVQVVTDRCSTVDRAAEPYVFAVCEFAKRAMDP